MSQSIVLCLIVYGKCIEGPWIAVKSKSVLTDGVSASVNSFLFLHPYSETESMRIICASSLHLNSKFLWHSNLKWKEITVHKSSDFSNIRG